MKKLEPLYILDKRMKTWDRLVEESDNDMETYLIVETMSHGRTFHQSNDTGAVMKELATQS